MKIKDIMEALGISAKILANEFGYKEEEILDIIFEKRKMSKIELLAFCKFTGISEEFLKGKKTATTSQERKIDNYISIKKREEELMIKMTSFKNAIIESGYAITEEELNDYYNPDKQMLNASIVKADKPKLLLAIYKAFPDIKVEGRFNGSSYSQNGNGVTLDEIRKNIVNIYTYKKSETYEYMNKFLDSDIVYFAEPSSEWLMLFVRGYFKWDNNKVLYLINNGAKYITMIGCDTSYDRTSPVYGEDIAITLMIKDYCEKHLSSND